MRKDDNLLKSFRAGALGLAGLLGLMPRRRAAVVVNEARDTHDPRDRQ